MQFSSVSPGFLMGAVLLISDGISTVKIWEMGHTSHQGMRQLLARGHCAIGDNLSTMEIQTKARKEAVHRKTKFRYVQRAAL